MRDPAKKLPDTNTILRYLIGDEPRLYEKAAKIFEKVRVGEEKAIILESVLVECVYVLTKYYKVPKKDASAKLRELLHYKGVANDDRDELIEALNIFAEKSSLDIVDCILCAKAKRPGMSLFTFDEALMSHSKRTSS
ncbi:MAG: PIN domain-containing protein [Deltaproteobacteria bacterium]|nr:PIN domain-containing protein [Deltaproteobacteria bacterium]MBI5810862.1 PIN domain-containing protein [Deltaproteobacteria bacterium]